MNKKKIEAFRFKPGQSGNPNGRPKKTVTLAKEAGYTLDDVRDRIKALLIKTIDELQKIYTDPESMMIDKIIANALKTDLKRGMIHTMETLLTRIWGAPKQVVENSGPDGGPIKFESVRRTVDKAHLLGAFETAVKVLKNVPTK